MNAAEPTASLLTAADVERLAEQRGLSMAEVCRRANVAPSIFSRWKSGACSPNLKSYSRIVEAASAA